MKKLISLFLIICIISTLFTTMPVLAKDMTDYMVYIIEEGEVTIEYVNDDFNDYFNGTIYIPSEIEGYPVTQIREEAFYGCDINFLTIPDTVRVIGYAAFADCDIRELDLGNGVEEIHMEAFAGNRRLQEVTIPMSVTYLEGAAFDYCERLENIHVEEGNENYKSIDGVLYTSDMWSLMKFPENKRAEVFRVPDEVYYIGSTAFLNCHELEGIETKADSTEYKAVDGVLFDTDMYTLKFYPAGKKDIYYNIPDSVHTIEYNAFYNNDYLTKIDLGSNLEHINADAFYSCDSLGYIEIPDTVWHLGERAFANCQSLVYAKIGNQVESIGRRAFAYCERLMHVELSEGTNDIGADTFSNCYSLESIVIPQSITEIWEETFKNDELINDIYYRGTEEQWQEVYIDEYNNGSILNADVHFEYTSQEPELIYDTTIDSVTITGCEMQFPGVIEIPDTIEGLPVTKIKNGAFMGTRPNEEEQCMKVVGIRLVGDNIIDISPSAFEYCGNLLFMEIKNNISDVNPELFDFDKGIINFKGFIVDDSNKKYSAENGILFSKYKSTLYKYPAGNIDTWYTIPETVKVIGTYAFADCINLHEINLNDGLTSIGDSAFRNCKNLESDNYELAIPKTVTYLGYSAFYGCESIRTVAIPVRFIRGSTFTNCYNLTEILIEKGITDLDAFYYSSLETVLYTGSAEDWAKIRGIDAPAIKNATIQFDYVPSLYGADIYDYDQDTFRVVADADIFWTSAVMGVSAYDENGALILTRTDIKGNNTKTTIPRKNVKTIKVFLWESLENPVPISESIVYNLCPQGVYLKLGYKYVSFDVQGPEVIDKATMIPAIKVFEELGIETDWDEETGILRASADDYTVTLTAGSDEMLVGDKKVELSREALKRNGELMIPVRAICDALEIDVSWTNDTKTITIEI